MQHKCVMRQATYIHHTMTCNITHLMQQQQQQQHQQQLQVTVRRELQPNELPLPATKTIASPAPQRYTNSWATELSKYRELSSYTSRFIVTINNRLYFEDNVTWLYINCVLRLLDGELREINLYLYSCEQRRPGYHLAEVRLQHYTKK